MRNDEKPAIRDLPLFRGIMDETFDTLMAATYSQEFPPQLDLFRQGDRADFLHILVEGSVQLHTEWRGREAIMAVIRPVSSFIVAACIPDAPYLMSARTQERSRIIMLPTVDLRTALGRDPALAGAVMSHLAMSFRGMVRQAKNLKLRTGRERLIAWLLSQARREGNLHTFTLPFEKRHLASYLGMTPESLSRVFNALKSEGITLDGSRVIIADHARLAEVAGLDAMMDDLGPDNGRAEPWSPHPGSW
ncbi:helix-turn-helix domain-containing protein [Paracoccus sp. CPCC 101403]|uniref:Helix-turn-helix domain-containing protein n=2 Tax=Paracoccus broussonetiae TaxID=3075834 RepID=A0ABU3E9Q5_9RHOB|nr:helix-turn-helix domain-containing protein [Paracoccus sp. CPCC 101403]MDT1060891.1 helix-turn-helix domain-containing protein [Paracoccus sp. CPCC 101403]